ncbi:succinate-semialdehyde dehydrogenase [Actinotalea ferrariae CF5-4]|uniref:succinate-semialdehyde dehydrogenase (NADP(+)) n=1 Tax=Actinotalea ferrariae CF5-4 TaxID=948458 RepID=A0A021VU24_9CELL|nr:succinic semialdehyde dehydrogenase [Actinotalea ferrariae]EYR64694.1 succinate-semialdehyde dehydrogenase [Actinotalea ferrariae CF5-4]
MSDTDVRDPETDPSATWALEPAEAARLLRTLEHGGAGGERVVSTPLTGAPLVALPLSTADDVAAAVGRARAVQRAWAARPLAERTALLHRVHDLLLARQSEVLDLVQLESGKARASAYEELADVVLVASHYARRARTYLAPRRVRGLVPGLTGTTVHRRPVGVVGVVAPWNYPLTLVLGDALPALAAGNAVVVKPDVQTSLTALWCVELLRAAGAPDGLLQVVTGDGPTVGSALVDAVDHVLFTGSTPTGRLVAQQAGRRLVGASLELGGKNALYVAEDADVEVAAEGAVRACFANTGQLCVSVERLVLHEDVADAFLAAFLPRVRALRLGAALDYSADVGSLTSTAQLERVQQHVHDAVERGASVLTGGVHRTDVGPFFYEPTVLDAVPADAVVRAEETFGPVVTVDRVPDDDAAVALVNASEYGLNASVWTRDVARGRRIAARLECGTVNVNEGYVASWGSTAAPIGGVKASGSGRRHGAEGIRATTWTQSVAVQRGTHRGLGLGRLFALPGERWTALFTRALHLRHRARL